MFFTELYFIIICAFAVFFLIRILQDPSLIYHFPYMMSFGFVVFILPQVFVLYAKSSFSTEATNRLFFMTLLCWGASFLGWYIYKPKSFLFKKTFFQNSNENKLTFIGVLFVMVGIFFNIIAYRILNTEDFGGQATGIVTVYIFFQQLLFLGTGLCLSLWLQNKKRINLIFAVIGILYGLYIGILLGRRTQALYTLVVLGIPLFAHYKIKPSRIIIISFMALSLLIIPSMSQYRQILKTSETTSEFFQRLFSEMDFKKNLADSYANSKSLELVNAGYLIDYTYRNSNYKLVFDYWNEVVFRFVPAQFVGKDVKRGLMVDFSLVKESRGHKNYNPNYIVGSTNTGIGDSFQAFDYFGCLFFAFIGMFMKRLWFTVSESKNSFLQVLYAMLLIESVISLTHGTTWFLPGFISVFLFLSIASWYSKS